MARAGGRRYDRKRILETAARATTKRRHREAITCYRRVLVAEPQNPEIHRRIAPLLARTRQPFDGWLSFRTAARALLRLFPSPTSPWRWLRSLSGGRRASPTPSLPARVRARSDLAAG